MYLSINPLERNSHRKLNKKNEYYERFLRKQKLKSKIIIVFLQSFYNLPTFLHFLILYFLLKYTESTPMDISYFDSSVNMFTRITSEVWDNNNMEETY